MALIDKASLLMVPSTYEAGTLYNVLPSGNRAPDSTDQNSGYDQTRADFTFDRGTDHGATRIGSDGLIKKYRENLLLQSNQFDTSPWTKFNTSLTSGQTGYDGSSDAWLLTATGADGNAYQDNTSTGVLSLSVYAKAGSTNWARLRFNNTPSSDANIWVNLTDGSIGVNNDGISSYVDSLGSGWYRIVLQTNTTDLAVVQIYPADADGSNSSTGSIYIQNAQLEASMVATDVLTSGATTGKAGVLIDLPRINYDANGENGALLLEPQRTNLLTHSEYLDAYTTISGGTFTANHGTSPEGVENAMRFLKSAGSRGGKFTSISVSSGTTYTISMYVKSLSGTQKIRIGADNGCSTPQDAETFSVGETWKRISKTMTSNQTNWNVFFDNVESGTACTGTYLGVDMLLYGFQVEAGSYVSSYIPNHSGTGGVTRAADSCSVTGVSDVIGQTEGVVFVEFDKKNGTGERRFFLQIGSGSTTIYARLESNNSLTTQILNGGTDYLTSTGTIIPSGNNKFAIGYANNDAVIYLNGTQLASSSSVVVPALSSLYVGSNSSNAQTIAGEIKQTTLFNERLSNAELAALTA